MKNEKWVHTVFISKNIYILALLFATVFSSIAQQNPYKQGEIVALVYHRFGDSRYPSTNIKKETFKTQLEYLKQHKYNVLSLSDACNRLYNGSGVPAKTIVITIDDGYKSFFKNGFPLLQQYNYPATVFINTKNIGNPDYMSWDELGILIDSGIEIGSHSHSHMYFLNESEEERSNSLLQEIEVSQGLFTEHLEYIPQLFSFPYGEFDKEMKEAVRTAGFKFAAAQNSGVISMYSDPYDLPRFPMNERYGSLKSFTSKIGMHALPVIKVEPEGPFFSENPPSLSLTLDPRYINQEQLQCFIAGSPSCNMTIIDSGENIKLKFISQYPLTNRRTLYTITAPLSNGKGWCWFSHVWIDPEIQE